ncbi:hypothetical protein [Halococcoides cellulosivorans]|uniref:Uncharacterized protein n=1 Tax=Halococcoides cellulosivorans TaxID=1679096 RepID=A0A2R4X1F1_9EURY|nr:hypothetical protein [Halococcoides cellulosivorans]AWB27605.1 hypothetical protein HARCEL1_07725 [Halococcoides cellulosivorans]
MDSTGPDGVSASDRSSGWTRRSVLGVAGTTAMFGLAGCSSQSPTAPSSDGDSKSLDVDREGYSGDAFAGRLTEGVESSEPAVVEHGIYEGKVVYDRSCESVGDGLTGCDAGIETADLGDINFYYEHDMQQKPCLTPDQQVALDVDDDGAVVQRRD